MSLEVSIFLLFHRASNIFFSPFTNDYSQLDYTYQQNVNRNHDNYDHVDRIINGYNNWAQEMDNVSWATVANGKVCLVY